jgi:hypothetical protein
MTSATPLQSLALLNSEFLLAEAGRMGARVAAGRSADEAGPAALADLCQMLLASNEFLHVE